MRKLLYILIVLGVSAGVLAQNNVYECDFEDANERAQWTLNAATTAVAPKLLNKWYIGQPGHFAPTGSNGLYVSASQGTEPDYDASQTMFVTATREMPTLASGDYTLYFDYRIAGKDNDGFYICWVPMTQATNGATNVGGKPAWVDTYKCDEIFSQRGNWTVGKVAIQHDGTPHKLVFLWLTSKGSVAPPSACIDNIELTQDSLCSSISNLRHQMQSDTVVLQWTGSADYYEVKCYDMDNDVWFYYPHVTGTQCAIPGVAEGVQSFVVRPHCANGQAGDYKQYVQLIYHKGRRCIDYMELTNSNCLTGPYGSPFSTRNKVDSGYASPMSHHTLHYMPNEYDERSNYQLKTRPDGYLASVRLGNYDSGNGTGEAVEYKYKVTGNETSILKIKYAAVLSNPHPDNPEINPRFWLDVLHNGRKIDNDCGYAFFTSGDSESSGWREGQDGWLWKPWTEQAINLRDFVGETLTIRLVTTDCQPGAHTGYAYFVLDCEGGELSDLNCGEDNPTTHFQAPSGFDYAWYLPANPYDTLGTDQDFIIQPMDTQTYNVNIINKNNKHCWYTLSVSGRPRIPAPSATYVAKAERCENVVTFTNTSHVDRQDMFNDTIISTDEKVTSLVWDFGDGTTVSSLQDQVTHTYPKEGGHYTLRLTAGVSNDACRITKEIPVTLPDLSQPTTELPVHACRGDYPFGYKYDEKWFFNDLDSIFTFTSTKTGCDSLVHFHLFFHETGPWEVHDTICEGDTLHFFDQRLTHSGDYYGASTNPWGCDSAVNMHLYMEPRLRVEIPDTLTICPEYNALEIPYAVQAGRLEDITISFDARSQEAGFEPSYTFARGEDILIPLPDDRLPDRYSATIHYGSPTCHVADKTIAVELNYSAGIIKQKGNLLSLMNADYNGGYEFVTYQWYRDGEPIPGATSPNLAVGESDKGHEFYIVITRKNDGLRLATCSLVFGATPLEEIGLDMLSAPFDVYSITGVKLVSLDAMEQIYSLPQGAYVLTDGTRAAKVVR